MLPNKAHVDRQWQPQLPRVLSSWWASSDLQKSQRFVEHLLWADRHGVIADIDAYLRELKADAEDWSNSWHISNEPLIYSPSLIAAYLATDYIVFADREFSINIGSQSADLGNLYQRTGFKGAIFITAWNPRGEMVSMEANADAQAQLRRSLDAAGYFCVDGDGRGTSAEWSPEASILALGCNRDDARALGREYQQNAVVWIDENAMPHLELLPYWDRRNSPPDAGQVTG